MISPKCSNSDNFEGYFNNFSRFHRYIDYDYDHDYDNDLDKSLIG